MRRVIVFDDLRTYSISLSNPWQSASDGNCWQGYHEKHNNPSIEVRLSVLISETPTFKAISKR